MPVLKGDRKTPKENIHQLKFTQILPREAFDFIGQYKEIVCPICGKINYAFKEPMLDNIRIRKDMIPEGVECIYFRNEYRRRSWIQVIDCVEKIVSAFNRRNAGKAFPFCANRIIAQRHC